MQDITVFTDSRFCSLHRDYSYCFQKFQKFAFSVCRVNERSKQLKMLSCKQLLKLQVSSLCYFEALCRSFRIVQFPPSSSLCLFFSHAFVTSKYIYSIWVLSHPMAYRSFKFNCAHGHARAKKDAWLGTNTCSVT